MSNLLVNEEYINGSDRKLQLHGVDNDFMDTIWSDSYTFSTEVKEWLVAFAKFVQLGIADQINLPAPVWIASVSMVVGILPTGTDYYQEDERPIIIANYLKHLEQEKDDIPF